MAELVVHSPLEVCQLALDAIGSTYEIASIEDPTEREEHLCKRQYPQAKRLLFEAADWPFASREALLSGLDDWASQQWEKAYGLPEDFIRARELLCGLLHDDIDRRVALPAIPYDFAQHGGVRVLVTNVTEPTLRYTADVEVRQWPAVFTEAMVWRLASRLAGPLKASDELANYAVKMAEHHLHAAIAAARNEVQPYPLRSSVLNRR